jgi:predicted nucleic acid-binding Zn ribbon protein
MSERKSCDIQPKRKASSEITPPPQLVAAEVRHVRPVRKEKTQRKEKKSKLQKQRRTPKGHENESLKVRRQRERRRSILMYCIGIIAAVAIIFGVFWWHGVRIQGIRTLGIETEGMNTIASQVIQGNYHYVIPRDSIFFFPKNEIRTDILHQYPDISAVSISRTSLSTISIQSIPREAALTWCGATYLPTQANASSSPETCFSADAEGVIFSPILNTDTIAPGALKVYAPISGVGVDGGSPLGSVINNASQIPNALQFIKVIKSLGVPIVAFVIRGDEADLYAQSGTRITYVIGHEEVSSQVAEAAFPSLNLNDRSLEYVDLRFEGKAYFKKMGAASATAATSTPGM